MENDKETTENTEMKLESVSDAETQITKKKSPVLFIIIAAVLIIAAVIIYFSFFSTAAVRNREIKAHLANAEKYLEDKDYENAIAEYEAILKLDPAAEDVLDDYIDTVLAYAEKIGSDDPDKAMDILNDAISFLEKLGDGDGTYDEYINKLQKEKKKYEEETTDEEEESDTEEDMSEEISDEPVINYTVEEIVLDDIGGDGWDYRYLTADDTVICLRSHEYGDEYSESIFTLDYEFYDMNGDLLKSYSFGTPDYEDYDNYVVAWSYYKFSQYHGEVGFVSCICEPAGHTLYIYDFKGNLVKAIDVVGGDAEQDFSGYLVNNFAYEYATPLYFEETDNDNYICLTARSDWSDSANWVPALYLDCTTLELKYPSDVEDELGESSEIEYDESVFSFCRKLETDNSEIAYFIETVDGKWGYADENFEIIALYEDASAFSIDGFALVTDDGLDYDLIDSDFNIVEEALFSGDGASLFFDKGNVFCVRNGEEVSYYRIEKE